MTNNAFPKGRKWNFSLDNRNDPAPAGIHFNSATLMQEIGQETVLILREQRQFMTDLRKHGPFVLNIKSGAVRTSAGPIVFMLWWFPPILDDMPYALYELLISPSPQPTISGLLEKASRQTHLHLVILDEEQEVFDVVEFENVYGLGNLLNTSREIGATLTGYDFNAAKKAFNKEIPLEYLFRM
jgi:hypothetical protein